jgi:hypothetical protein
VWVETSRHPRVGASAQPLKLALTLVGTALLAVVVPFVPSMSRIVLTAFSIAVVMIYLAFRKKDGPTDPLEVVIPYSVLHIVYFGVGALYLSFYPKAPFKVSLDPYVTMALALGVVGLCAFLGGYAFFFTRAAPSRARGLVPRGSAMCVVAGVLGTVAFLASTLLPRISIVRELGLSSLFSPIEHLAPLFLFAWFLSWAMFWKDPRSARNRFQVVALTCMALLVIYLTLGRKELGITILAFPSLAYGYVKHRFPIKSFVALLLILVFVIFPLYNTFRYQKKSLDASERLQRSVRQATHWQADEYVERSMGAFFSRTALITSVAAILKDTGRWVDFAKGRTLLLLPVGLLIPRFVWPDKPVLNVAKEFGQTFQLVGALDEETNIAPTMVGELYWNFQVPGVLIGMAVLGACYRWYYERYGRGRGFDPVRRSMYMALLPAALHSEGVVALTIAGIVESIVLFSAITFLFRRMGALAEARDA